MLESKAGTRGQSESGERVEDPYRVMLVDDSAVVRGLIRRTLEAEPTLEIVAAVGDGVAAVSRVAKGDVEVVVLDIEMPRMDGITALSEMLKIQPDLQIVMASTLTQRNADISLKAIADGAKDYIAKPSTNREVMSAEEFNRELLAKVKGLGVQARQISGKPAPSKAWPGSGSEAKTTSLHRPVAERKPVTLKARLQTSRPVALGIGSSTGGPAALFEVLSSLPRMPGVPIFITQHMPATFTPMLAKHITDKTPWTCKEAEDGERVTGGQAYLAPGDFHMRVHRADGGAIVRLDQGPQINYCRPSVDPMLQSLVEVYGERVLAVILTGMGRDGARGCVDVRAAGGDVVAQDKETSVVWGMPGAVASSGEARAVLPLTEIGYEISRAFGISR